MSIVQKLTEGMVHRNMQQEGAALLNKWSQTGLLEGLTDDNHKASMARLLENQARELLRESNTMAGGDVEGFAAVAFPIVRRVFAGLIANDLVSVQPMSLPSGLIFFLDFTFSDTDPNNRLGTNGEESLYGQGIVGSEVTGGVVYDSYTMDKQPFGFSSGYSSPTGSAASATTLAGDLDATTNIGDVIAAGNGGLFKFDPDVALLSGSALLQLVIDEPQYMNTEHLSQIVVTQISGATTGVVTVGADASNGEMQQVRRLTKRNDDGKIVLTFLTSSALVGADTWEVKAHSWAQKDQFGPSTNNDLGAIVADVYSLEGNPNIPEIDIKVDSIAITATTKKLKAKWILELG
jgi:hypothetical protein